MSYSNDPNIPAVQMHGATKCLLAIEEALLAFAKLNNVQGEIGDGLLVEYRGDYKSNNPRSEEDILHVLNYKITPEMRQLYIEGNKFVSFIRYYLRGIEEVNYIATLVGNIMHMAYELRWIPRIPFILIDDMLKAEALVLLEERRILEQMGPGFN